MESLASESKRTEDEITKDLATEIGDREYAEKIFEAAGDRADWWLQ